MTRRPDVPSLGTDELRELGVQIASRLVAVVRMGRSYPLGNPVLTGQLEQLLAVVGPVMSVAGEARVTEVDGEPCVNDVRLPSRAGSERAFELLVHELRMRRIAGVVFRRGLELEELESFMRFFLSSEVYKDADLERACAAQGLAHVAPLPYVALAPQAAAPALDAPAPYRDALAAHALVAHDLEALLGGGMQPALEVRHVRRALQPLVDAALAGAAVTAPLAELDAHRTTTLHRGLQVAIVAIACGAALGLDRSALTRLGAAALLHAVAGPERPADLVATLAAIRTLPLGLVSMTALDAALAQHAREGAGATLAADLVAIAQAWIVLAAVRAGEESRWTPHEALGLVLAPLATRFHPASRLALVRAIGLHPPGQVIELDDGSVARVAAADPADPERPLVEPLGGPAGAPLPASAHGVVTALPAGRTVRRDVPFSRRPGEGDPRHHAA